MDGTLTLPACWKQLAGLDFQDRDVETADTPLREIDVDDPEPYRDDERIIETELDDGLVYALKLLSGSSNYYCEAELYDPDAPSVDEGIVFRYGPFYDLGEVESFTTPDGREYELNFSFTEDYS